MRAPLDFKPFVAHIIPPRASDPLGNFAPVGVLGVFTAYFGGVSFSPNLDVTSGARIKRRSPRVHVIRDAQGTTCCPGKPLGRPLTAISPLTRSLEGATTLFRTRPLPCHHALSGNWAGSLNFDSFPLAHEFQNDCGESLTALRANQQAMGARTRQRRRDGNYRIHRVRTCTLATSLAVGDYGMLFNRDQRRSATAIGGRSVDNSGETGLKEKRAIRQSPETMGSTCAKRACEFESGSLIVL